MYGCNVICLRAAGKISLSTVLAQDFTDSNYYIYGMATGSQIQRSVAEAQKMFLGE